MIEVAMDNTTRSMEDNMTSFAVHESDASILTTPVHSFYHREGLIRYILCCCQGESGGLRDKPGK